MNTAVHTRIEKIYFSNDVGEVLLNKITKDKGSVLFAKEGVSLYKAMYMNKGKDFPFYVIPER